jgi:hypothetical protein
MREAYVLNPNSISAAELEQFYMMGVWIGNAIRQGAPLSLNLHPSIWKRLVGQDEFTLRDLKYLDMLAHNELLAIRDAAAMSQSDEEFAEVIDQTFTVTFGGGD